jgi:hypothetical protein
MFPISLPVFVHCRQCGGTCFPPFFNLLCFPPFSHCCVFVVLTIVRFVFAVVGFESGRNQRNSAQRTQAQDPRQEGDVCVMS